MSGLAAIYVLMGCLTITFAAIYMLFFFQGAMQETNEKLPADLNDIDKKQTYIYNRKRPDEKLLKIEIMLIKRVFFCSRRRAPPQRILITPL